ncbi:hypothetical protein EG346_04965 [Chryseobacterium carnipullorum]|uniref:Uncharacterized protein n=1 Tax=Chryseobacterium carnipullorum TaxID=1124835 RepID=A0A3G6NME4_CHRCU|nr:hypothetical protein [Chryseobacterium carnipullorum]AZA47576.1 hypothetical protein EG346_04965 [Chryseobacterium carnipullorum]AZA66906.1 hypothetical protein EG345_21100 [Chryseobacterium carnipullorum]
MLLLAFLAIAIVYYLIQKDKIRKAEKRDIFKEKQEKNYNSFLKKQEKKMQKKLKKINDEYYERI